MKKLGCAVAMLAAVAFTAPVPASAGASTDAALALGAFAVFNQLARGETVLHDAFGYRTPPPQVIYAPPPVVYAPAPVVYAPPPAVIYVPRPVYYAAPRHFVPPGHMKHGHWKAYRHDD